MGDEKLKLGKGVAFVKSRLKRLPQEEETWEADFQALPQPIMQSETEYLGMVVEKQDGWFLAELTVHGRPTVNDQWRELFPALKELGIEVSIESTLPRFNEAYQDYLQEMQKEQRAEMVKPGQDQTKVESMFPAIAKYVRGYGYVEIGDQESFGFVVRAIGYGGLDFEDDTPENVG